MTDVEVALQNLRGSVRFTRDGVESLLSACEQWLYQSELSQNSYLRGPEFVVETPDDELTDTIVEALTDQR